MHETTIYLSTENCILTQDWKMCALNDFAWADFVDREVNTVCPQKSL